MISQARKLMVFCTTLMLAACTTQVIPLQDGPMVGQLVPLAGQGIVILAVTLDSLDRDSATAGLIVLGPDGDRYLPVSIRTDRIHVPGNRVDDVGRLYVQTLPPGDYVAQKLSGRWRAASGPNEGMGNMFNRIDSNLLNYRYEEVVLNAPFHVNADESIYLGDFHLSLNFQPDATISDQCARDFNDLAMRYKVLKTSNIAVRIPKARLAP